MSTPKETITAEFIVDCPNDRNQQKSVPKKKRET